MKEAFLIRNKGDDEGTLGNMMVFGDSPFSCYSLELPNRNNAARLSRINAGMYLCNIYHSPKFGWVFHLTDVAGRSYVLIHSGNYAGDILQGWRTHSAGCILLGIKPVKMHGQKAVTNSRSTLDSFMRIMGKETFRLHIIEPITT